MSLSAMVCISHSAAKRIWEWQYYSFHDLRFDQGVETQWIWMNYSPINVASGWCRLQRLWGSGGIISKVSGCLMEPWGTEWQASLLWLNPVATGPSGLRWLYQWGAVWNHQAVFQLKNFAMRMCDAQWVKTDIYQFKTKYTMQNTTRYPLISCI